MWIETYGNFQNPFENYPTKVWYINTSEELIIFQMAGYSQKYFMMPISGLPFQRYFFKIFSDNVSFELEPVDGDNWSPILRQTGIIPGHRGNYMIEPFTSLYCLVNDYFADTLSHEPITGFFTDLDENDHYFGDINFVYRPISSGFSGTYFEYTTSGNVNQYGELTLSSVLDIDSIPILSSSTLYGVYTNIRDENETRIFGDSIIYFSRDNHLNYGKLNDYDESLNGYKINCYTEGTNATRKCSC